jgi:hypothetical protein
LAPAVNDNNIGIRAHGNRLTGIDCGRADELEPMAKIQHLCGSSRTVEVVQGQVADHAPIQRSKGNGCADAARSDDRQMIHVAFDRSAR